MRNKIITQKEKEEIYSYMDEKAYVIRNDFLKCQIKHAEEEIISDVASANFQKKLIALIEEVKRTTVFDHTPEYILRKALFEYQTWSNRKLNEVFNEIVDGIKNIMTEGEEMVIYHDTEGSKRMAQIDTEMIALKNGDSNVIITGEKIKK